MSDKEIRRRTNAKLVLISAWRFKKRDPLSISLPLALTLSWATFQSRVYVRHSKAMGVTFEGRQRVLAELSRIPEERISLRLRHEKDNKYDETAVKIYAVIDSSHRACVGYLKKETAIYIAPQIDNGKRCIAFYDGVTGGGGKRWGLNFSYALL